ncbi:MAG: polysaccharide pyruvyl transferase family protein [Lachnospiraceae bacterium]|nr:polysaccharide pyruvyl transferase family protein [Lachnospiraceae bacterium]
MFDLDYKWARFRKLDVRAVRGPETRRVLCRLGYDCPEIYGDPACLLPLFYHPANREKKHAVSVILHHSVKDAVLPEGIHRISMCTTDYKSVINEIVSSEVIISGSLHGIILAEAYGIPAVLLKDREPFELLKYKDYFSSTDRNGFRIANSIQEALNMEPNELPCLGEMQERLLKCFPVDLWEDRKDDLFKWRK